MLRCSLLLALLALVACGPTPAPSVDAPEIPGDTLPAGCDYQELRDLTNDDVAPATGTPEATDLTHAGRTVICGTIDETHFDGDITVDVDGYVVTLAADADVLVRIAGAGAEAIELVGVDIYGGAAFDELAGQITFYGDHGVTAVRLPAGTYEFAAFALALEAISAPVAYRLEIADDAPDVRCPILTGGYAETGDGGGSTGNNMVDVPSGAPPALTTASDQPEPTQLVLTPDVLGRIAGTAANIAMADQYEDKDTFEVMTGPTTNELGVRLDWTGAANLDVLVFEAGSAEPITRVITDANTGPETKTFSVKPSTSYWILVGAKAGGTLPVTYGASLCGASFAP